jgi:hypothetical protein
MDIIGNFMMEVVMEIHGEFIFLRVGHGCCYFWSLSVNFDCLSKVNGMKRENGVWMRKK